MVEIIPLFGGVNDRDIYFSVYSFGTPFCGGLFSGDAIFNFVPDFSKRDRTRDAAGLHMQYDDSDSQLIFALQTRTYSGMRYVRIIHAAVLTYYTRIT